MISNPRMWTIHFLSKDVEKLLIFGTGRNQAIDGIP